MKYEDLKCEFCNGQGEKEKWVDGFGDSNVICTFCNGTGIDQDQLKKLNTNTHLRDEIYCPSLSDCHNASQQLEKIRAENKFLRESWDRARRLRLLTKNEDK